MSLCVVSVVELGLDEVHIPPTFIHVINLFIQHGYERFNYLACHRICDQYDALPILR